MAINKFIADYTKLIDENNALLEKLEAETAAREAAEAECSVYLGALRACKTALLGVWANQRLGSPTEQALFKIMDGIDAATKDEPTIAEYAARDALAAGRAFRAR